jgi:hypothetical protein
MRNLWLIALYCLLVQAGKAQTDDEQPTLVDSLRSDERMLLLDAMLRSSPSYEASPLAKMKVYTIVKLATGAPKRNWRRNKFTQVVYNDTMGYVVTGLIMDNAHFQKIRKNILAGLEAQAANEARRWHLGRVRYATPRVDATAPSADTNKPTPSADTNTPTPTSPPAHVAPQTSTIHTGPRGGRFYYNSKGNKTYIKRK